MARICSRSNDGVPCNRETLDARVTLCYWHRLAKTNIPGQAQAARRRRAAALAEGPERARVAPSQWPDGERFCAGCQSFVPIWYCQGSRCAACTRAAAHVSRLKNVYQSNEEEWEAITLAQGGRCAICRKHSRDRSPAADHDHSTGALRGALCKRCNRDLLGGAHDSPRALAAALIYLLFPPAAGHWVAPEIVVDDVIRTVQATVAAANDVLLPSGAQWLAVNPATGSNSPAPARGE